MPNRPPAAPLDASTLDAVDALRHILGNHSVLALATLVMSWNAPFHRDASEGDTETTDVKARLMAQHLDLRDGMDAIAACLAGRGALIIPETEDEIVPAAGRRIAAAIEAGRMFDHLIAGHREMMLALDAAFDVVAAADDSDMLAILRARRTSHGRHLLELYELAGG
ncbi:MAG: hypothetical protein AAF205_10665 [Pseudomonadota bacterium]